MTSARASLYSPRSTRIAQWELDLETQFRIGTFEFFCVLSCYKSLNVSVFAKSIVSLDLANSDRDALGAVVFGVVDVMKVVLFISRARTLDWCFR